MNAMFGETGTRAERTALLPTQRREIPSSIDSKEVTKTALRLRYQVEQVVPCELEEDTITRAHSSVITPAVVKTAKEAGGEGEGRCCVVFALLICKRWFHRQALLELWDAEMHEVRAVACEMIAKRIIEEEEDMDYLLEHVLLKRFSIFVDGKDTPAANVIERAVDLHALTVIGSAGYQKAVNYLWRGWIMQDDEDPTRFVPYKQKANTSYWAHLDPDRMRVPRYQNAVQVLISILFLALYTQAINTINPSGDLDVVEGLLYLFTFAFICDEVTKLWKVGRYYIGFWNVFNSTLYALLAVSFILRMVALGHDTGSERRGELNVLSYNFLAFTAPMFWLRLMLYFDSFRFFGAMLVVTKVMLKESIIFFALLAVVLIGFLQAFIGLDQIDQNLDATSFVIENMVKPLLSSPEFEGFDNFGHPFGLILYYIYSFVVMTILLNILIALFNSAYDSISSNSTDEYMALFAAKCLQFARAADENVFIPPFNLIEIFGLIIPFEWWLPRRRYERLNNFVMGFIYAPVLLVTAFIEQRNARVVRANRKRGEVDEDTVEEWEQLSYNITEESKQWVTLVERTTSDVVTDETLKTVRQLKEELQELKDLLRSQTRPTAQNGGEDKSQSRHGNEGDGDNSANSGFGLHD